MIFAVFSVIYLNQKLDPLVCAAATPQIKAEMTRVINEAISEAMTGYEEKLVSIRYGSDGKILSIETDSAKINLLRALVTEKINKKSRHTENTASRFPFQTFLMTKSSSAGFRP